MDAGAVALYTEVDLESAVPYANTTSYTNADTIDQDLIGGGHIGYGETGFLCKRFREEAIIEPYRGGMR